MKAMATSICMMLVAVGGACAFTGCKDSLALTNIEHSQDASEVDHDSGKTKKIVSEDGKITNKDTGLHTTKTSKKDKKMKLNVVYTSADAQTELPTSKFHYDKNSKNSSEATEGVSQKTTDNQNHPQREDKKKNKKNKGNEKSDKKDKGSGSKNKGDKGKGKSDKDSKAKVYDTTGANPDIPDVSSVAAYGQTAVIVQMLAGQDNKTSLVAADSELLKSDFSEVFSDEGTSSIIKAWSKDGSSSSELDIKALVKAKPDTVLTTSDAYFTKKQQSALAKASISITVVPGLNSATGIKVAVDTIGQMLDKETSGASSERAKEYVSFHDGLVSDIEGDRGYGAYDKDKDYFFDDNAVKKPKLFSAKRFTLLIDKWDSKASYNYNGAITTANVGIGLSSVGYRTSPVSYYIGVAGVVNNAAAVDIDEKHDGQLIPAWQFNVNTLSPSKIRYSGSVKGTVYSSWTSSFVKSTLAKVNSSSHNYETNGFGTDTFPVVIVADNGMKKSFLKSASSSKGVYHAFGWVEDDGGSYQGVKVGNVDIFSAISDEAKVEDIVKVNPHGLFSSWIEGSAEACLESAWIANIDEFDNDWNGKATAKVKEFYKTFYRYDLSDAQVEKIMAGEK